MPVGSKFHRSNAATGKERRPTVVSRNGGTSSCCDDEGRSRRRPSRSETRTSWFRYTDIFYGVTLIDKTSTRA